MMDLKELAAREAVKYVDDGMVVGLGSGSTASIAIRLIGEMVKQGAEIIGVPTSKDSEALGRKSGIRISDLNEHPRVDLTIDGADEVDPELNLIKGLGGALVREKIVAAATDLEIVVVDSSKLVDHLGQKAPLPVEIVTFGHRASMKRLESLGCVAKLRERNGAPFVSDNGNYIADCRFKRIERPAEMESGINNVPGVVDNGLFVRLAAKVIVASQDGVRTMDRED